MRARYTPYGERITGSITDRYESVRSAFAISRYCGTARITGGISTPVSRMLKMLSRPRKRYTARAYPETAETAVDSSAPTPAYRAELAIHLQYTPFRYADRSATLSAKPDPGRKVKVEKS